MLISMTGFGAATSRADGYLISSEIKSVNNRFLKTSIRLPEGFASLETKVDELLHAKIVRGSVNFTLRIERENAGADCGLNFGALVAYLGSATLFRLEHPEFNDVPLGTVADFARLPGVLRDAARDERDSLPEKLWSAVAANVNEALDRLQVMRKAEGASTLTYLSGLIGNLRSLIGRVKELAPGVVENYRTRLTERVQKVLSEVGATLQPADVIREIAIFTDRADISEEIARFYSHLDQFDAALANEDACGKKLDFLTQEMFRETNTIGSKANSPDVLACVVEMKSEIERVREMVQNVE